MDLDDPADAAALAAQKAAAAAEAQRLFSTFDTDDSGSLDKAEVKLLLESQGVCVTPQYLAGLIEAFDEDGDGTFDRDEFAQLAAVVIGRSVDAQNDVESLWYWLGLKYRFVDDMTGTTSQAMSIDVVQMKIARGQITDETPFQCTNQTGGWEPLGPLSEWKEFYDEGFIGALAQAGKRTTRPEDAGDLFDQYDADGSGALDREEVIALLGGFVIFRLFPVWFCVVSVHVFVWFRGCFFSFSLKLVDRLGLATDDGYIDGMLDAFDTDKSGDVDREEFQKLFEAVLRKGTAASGGEEGTPEVGVESALFWMGVQYRYMDELGGEAHGIESTALSFGQFKSTLMDGSRERPLDDETPLQISEPGGGWLPWRTIGEYKRGNEGFRAAIDAATAAVAEAVPPLKSDGEEDELHQIHVRGIGVDGWDGTDDGVGTFETEAALDTIFSKFGTVLFSKIRHRIADGANTSWVRFDSLFLF